MSAACNDDDKIPVVTKCNGEELIGPWRYTQKDIELIRKLLFEGPGKSIEEDPDHEKIKVDAIRAYYGR